MNSIDLKYQTSIKTAFNILKTKAEITRFMDDYFVYYLKSIAPLENKNFGQSLDSVSKMFSDPVKENIGKIDKSILNIWIKAQEEFEENVRKDLVRYTKIFENIKPR